MNIKAIISYPVPPGIEDLTGQRFGYLTVVSYAGKNRYSQHIWNCICDCGYEKVIIGINLKSNNKSCARHWICKFARSLRSINSTYILSSTIEYLRLRGMISRCYDPNHPMFHNYGGRLDVNGNPDPVIVHQEWIDKPQTFKDYCDSGQMPETLKEFQARCPGITPTIDRIDNSGHYIPLNIQWATDQEQNQNMKSNVLNEEKVKFIKTETKNGKSGAEIFRLLKTNYNYQGHIETIRDVIRGKSWTNINIDSPLPKIQK